MSLKRVLHSECLDSISSIKNGVVYYVYYGRNAWHSTWVSLYRDGAFHHSLSSAKIYCEKQRVQGSVFNIHELPAIVIKSKNRVSYITEINTQSPLIHYVANPQITDQKGVSKESTVAEVENSFLPSSDHWKVKPAPDNSVIILYDELSDGELRLPGDINRRKAYKSYSHGTYEALGWSEGKSEILSKGISQSIHDLGVKPRKPKQRTPQQKKLTKSEIEAKKIEAKKIKKAKFFNLIFLAVKELGYNEGDWIPLENVIQSIKKDNPDFFVFNFGEYKSLAAAVKALRNIRIRSEYGRGGLRYYYIKINYQVLNN